MCGQVSVALFRSEQELCRIILICDDLSDVFEADQEIVHDPQPVGSGDLRDQVGRYDRFGEDAIIRELICGL